MGDESKYGNVKEDEEMGAYAQYMKMVLSPDLKEKNPELFTKELKSSNLQKGDLVWCEDGADLAWQMKVMAQRLCGKIDKDVLYFWDFLPIAIQYKLCGSNSINGFFQVMQQTQIKREILSEEGKKGKIQQVFDRKKGEKE